MPAGKTFPIASADAAIAPVTSNDASVTSAKAAVDAYAAVASQEVGLIGLSGATDVHV